MKSLLILSLVILSTSAFSQTKAVKAVIPESAQKTKTTKNEKAPEAPCADSKEDVLKKLEEKKKTQAMAGKGFSLQGSTDTGCSIK